MRPVVRRKFDFTIRDDVQSTFGQTFHRNIPLIGQHRFNNGIGAIAARRHEFVGFGLNQETLCFQISNDLFPSIKTIHALIFNRRQIIDFSIQGKNTDRNQMVPLSHLVIIKVVCRGDFDTPCAEFQIDISVCNDGDCPLTQRQPDMTSDQVLITRIVRMYGNCDIAKHGFMASGGDN